MERRIVISTDTLLGLAVFSAFCLMAVTGTKVFEPWSQVTQLWNSGWSLMHLIDHFHFERYLAAYPGLFLEEIYPGTGFSLYIACFVALNTLIFRRVHKGFTGYPPGWFAYVVFLLSHLAMNGRGPIGWLGWLLCLYLHARFINPDRTGSFLTFTNSFLLFLTLLFSSVSSGVFIVVFMANTLLVVRILRASRRVQRLTLMRIISSAFALVIMGYGIYRAVLYLLDAILKIYLFFGSYTGAIIHGLGIVTERFDAGIVSLLVLIMVIGAVWLWTSLKDHVAPVLWFLFACSMVGGGFGFTALTLNIPLFLIFFSVFTRLLLRRSIPETLAT